ncbi:hypothetical protein ACFOY4_27350 [Actinomadura syzygii]|nr:hypothetical protein [Actinomadura syzygii]
MTAVWTALTIETCTALVIAASLAGWARRRFATGEAVPAPAEPSAG